jgi:hypothetical protein
MSAWGVDSSSSSPARTPFGICSYTTKMMDPHGNQPVGIRWWQALCDGPIAVLSARLAGQALPLGAEVPIAYLDPAPVASRAEMEEGIGGKGDGA